MRNIYVSVVLVGVVAVAALAQQQSGPAITNFLRINSEICTGGQPTPEQLSQLKAQGVTTVINLRSPGENGFDAPGEEVRCRPRRALR